MEGRAPPSTTGEGYASKNPSMRPAPRNPTAAELDRPDAAVRHADHQARGARGTRDLGDGPDHASPQTLAAILLGEHEVLDLEAVLLGDQGCGANRHLIDDRVVPHEL